jgi:hypothetical protein
MRRFTSREESWRCIGAQTTGLSDVVGTVRAIAAISYRFLARAALLRRQMPCAIE